MNSKFFGNQESIILKAKNIIKSFDIYDKFLIIG